VLANQIGFSFYWFALEALIPGGLLNLLLEKHIKCFTPKFLRRETPRMRLCLRVSVWCARWDDPPKLPPAQIVNVCIRNRNGPDQVKYFGWISTLCTHTNTYIHLRNLQVYFDKWACIHIDNQKCICTERARMHKERADTFLIVNLYMQVSCVKIYMQVPKIYVRVCVCTYIYRYIYI